MNNLTSKLSVWSKIGIVCLMFFSFNTILAQSNQEKQEQGIEVKGTVSNESGVLKGVNVALEGTKLGTTTDSKGNFKFPKKLKKGDVLIFSYLGLETQKIVVNNNNSASSIELNLDMALTEVTVMGNASSKKAFKSKKSR